MNKMSSKENLRPLKILVFSMGLLLIGGTVLLFGIILKKMSQEKNMPPVVQECKGGALDLKGRGLVMESKLENNVLRLTLEKGPGHTEMLTVDACSGEITSTLVIDSDASLPVE
jgi:hypothetical protein